MEQHFLPKKCGYCGKYFLLEAGIFLITALVLLRIRREKSAVMSDTKKIC
jgi:hypothetical protein